MNAVAAPASPPLHCERIDPLTHGRWDRLLQDHRDASIFHSSAWARVLHKTYRHRPSYLRFASGASTVALIPLMEVRSPLTGTRGVSLPFSDFCGPLWADAALAETVIPALIETCRAQGWSHFDLRSESRPPAGTATWRIHHGHLLDLTPGLPSLECGLSTQASRSIRKAAGSGVAVAVDQSRESVREFYRLHCLTRRRHGVPPQSYRFFEHLHAEIIAPGEGHVILARHGKETIAGAIFLKFQETSVYKFGASDVRHWPLCPNHAVMWEGISLMSRLGCRSLHFGRTATNDKGLSRFKSSWGTDITSISQYRYSFRDRGWKGGTEPAAENHRAIFGWLPLRFNRILGSLIYPHLD